MGKIRVPPTWVVSFSFGTNKGRRVAASVNSFGDDFLEAMDNLDESALEAAGLSDEATPKLDDNETLTEVNLHARRTD